MELQDLGASIAKIDFSFPSDAAALDVGSIVVHIEDMSDGKNLEAHLFICTNLKEKGESCAQKGSVQLRNSIKELCQDEKRGWHGRIRVNTSGCLGRCSEGITAVLYPQATWMTGLTESSSAEVSAILSKVLDKN